jgi:hypothetical protein
MIHGATRATMTTKGNALHSFTAKVHVNEGIALAERIGQMKWIDTLDKHFEL